MKRSTICLTIVMSLLLGGCQTLYRPIITQGSEQALSAKKRIKKGMSKEQVANIMGTPLSVAPFDDDIWEYWFIQTRGQRFKNKSGVRLHFKNSHLIRIEAIT